MKEPSNRIRIVVKALAFILFLSLAALTLYYPATGAAYILYVATKVFFVPRETLEMRKR
jgi:hypothetical protein